MWTPGVLFLVLVALATVSAKPFEVYDKEVHGISKAVAKSEAEAASISGKGHYGSAAAEASAAAIVKGDHKYGGVSVAKADAASKAVSSDHYGKGSVAKSAANAKAAAISMKKEHKPEHDDEKHYFGDQPQGDDPHAYFYGSKAAAAAESSAKSVGSKYHKGVSLAESLAKSESFSGKGISASSAQAKSVSVSA